MPGLFTDEQVEGWRALTEAVHAEGGTIFAQLQIPAPCHIRTFSRAHRTAAQNARAAGFDDVEIHAGTTYLLPEFLNSALNVREDAYGGSAENRARIVVEILGAVTRDGAPDASTSR